MYSFGVNMHAIVTVADKLQEEKPSFTRNISKKGDAGRWRCKVGSSHFWQTTQKTCTEGTK